MARADWTDSFLEDMRRQGDPAADGFVRTVFEQNDVDSVNRLLGALLSGRIRDDAPAALVRYLDETSSLPSWTDPQKIAIAEQLAVSYGFLCAGVLYTAGLPTCYASRGIAAVLAATLRL